MSSWKAHKLSSQNPQAEGGLPKQEEQAPPRKEAGARRLAEAAAGLSV